MIRTVYHIARADFLERTRGYGFLVTIALSVMAAYFFVPPADSSYALLVIDGQYRGVYNSAWIGVSVSLAIMSITTLIGFFMVKNPIDRDRRTQVGQIISTAPLRKFDYLLGKFISNFIVLTIIVVVTFFIAIVMQWLRGEDTNVYLGTLLPFLFIITLPAMTVVAAVAILFETIPFLKGGFGNVIYFFVLWAPSVMLFFSTTTFHLFGVEIPISGFTGREIYWNSITDQYKQLYPEASAQMADGIVLIEDPPLKTFLYTGLKWTNEIIISRMFWLVVAFLIIILASFLFRGFDKSVNKKNKGFAKKIGKQKLTISDKENKKKWLEVPDISLSHITLNFNFFTLLLAEFRLVLKEQKWWWYVGAFALIILCLLSPMWLVKELFAPLSWVWPILIWSNLGVRETRYFTRDIIFSSPYPIHRQIPASWLSGFVIALITGSGLGIRYLVSGEIVEFLAWIVGAMFIPTFALVLGVWTGTKKSFEALFMTLMFVGILNKQKYVDFMGIVEGSIDLGMPIVFLVITFVLMIFSIYGRRKQIQR
ncbi:ABC transporter permease [Bacillus cereus group sp. BfR-BA-01380]|uniref:ABC transporter permease n=1 Tax=Bacillus cereus group sp. BfR-BA-01380 TaxID=2920324 RepID=UPI001F56816B|nr:ABC transporter permease [Bacillus cereus group sp. BfR-BA-01380]